MGTLAGGNAEVPLLTLMAKWLEVHGTLLRPRTTTGKAAAVAAFVAEVVPLLAAGRVEPVVERVFPLEQAAEAYALVESDATFGKVILRAV